VGAQVIGLIVDIHTDGRGSAPNLEIICHVSPGERLFACFIRRVRLSV
jgi:hypothetical protein